MKKHKVREITLEEAETLAMQTDYAVFANEDTETINTSDAGAFYMEGYNSAVRECSSEDKKQNSPSWNWLVRQMGYKIIR